VATGLSTTPTFNHNTQDGLDLLYANTQATIKVTHSHAEGNAGNQMKLAGSPTVENSTIVGNCAYFQGIDNMSGNNSVAPARPVTCAARWATRSCYRCSRR